MRAIVQDAYVSADVLRLAETDKSGNSPLSRLRRPLALKGILVIVGAEGAN